MINYEGERRRYIPEPDDNLHYSLKGGHRKRSEYWDFFRSQKTLRSVPKEMSWIIRRSMFRDPRSGR